MLEKTIYRTIAFVTETFPKHGARCLDRLIFSLAGNRLAPAILSKRNVRRLKAIRKIETVCVLCDMNIGDAVMTQACVSAIRSFLPGARIDYVAKRSAACLVEGNPEIDRVYGAYEGSPFPGRRDIQAVDAILSSGPYDLVFNFCPFVSKNNVRFPERAAVIGCGAVVADVVRAQSHPGETSHVMYRMYRFAYDLFSQIMRPVRPGRFAGGRVTLDEAAAGRARAFLSGAGSGGDVPTILFNPDTSSVFTRVPLAMQSRILSGLSGSSCRILLGGGHVVPGIETLLLGSLPENKRRKIRVVPSSLPIDAYAALIDCCDLFITGDTGPLHIAAARKFARDGKRLFRNKTAVLSIYAAQPARLYAYDSSRPGFLGSAQDAEAHVYETKSCCRNMATVNKAYIACKEPAHFFQDLDIRSLTGDAERILLERSGVTLPSSSRSSRRAS